MKHFLSLIFLLSALPLSAQRADTLRAVDHSWLFGVGRTHVLDTYLSPQDYVGAGFSLSHRTERKARWGRDRVMVVAHYRADAAHLTGSSGDGREWDANLRLGVGWMWNKKLAKRPFRLAFGPLVEVGTGVTYNTRNGTNPAQGRLFMMWQQQDWRNMTSTWGGSNGRRAPNWQCPSPDWLSRPPMGSPTMSCSVLAIATIIVWSPMCSMRLRSIFSPRSPSRWAARASRWAMGSMCGRVVSTISKPTTGRTNLSLATRADCDY